MNKKRFGMMMVLGLLLWGPAEVQAESLPYADRTTFERTALTTGAVLGSVVYTPAKAVYAAGGTVAGGLVFLMSAGQSSTAATRILDRSARGDWYVHPDHLTGNRGLHFRGETTGPPPTAW